MHYSLKQNDCVQRIDNVSACFSQAYVCSQADQAGDPSSPSCLASQFERAALRSFARFSRTSGEQKVSLRGNNLCAAAQKLSSCSEVAGHDKRGAEEDVGEAPFSICSTAVKVDNDGFEAWAEDGSCTRAMTTSCSVAESALRRSGEDAALKTKRAVAQPTVSADCCR